MSLKLAPPQVISQAASAMLESPLFKSAEKFIAEAHLVW